MKRWARLAARDHSGPRRRNGGPDRRERPLFTAACCGRRARDAADCGPRRRAGDPAAAARSHSGSPRRDGVRFAEGGQSGPRPRDPPRAATLNAETGRRARPACAGILSGPRQQDGVRPAACSHFGSRRRYGGLGPPQLDRGKGTDAERTARCHTGPRRRDVGPAPPSAATLESGDGTGARPESRGHSGRWQRVAGPRPMRTATLDRRDAEQGGLARRGRPL